MESNKEIAQEEVTNKFRELPADVLINTYLKLIKNFDQLKYKQVAIQQTIHCINDIIKEDEDRFLPILNEKKNTSYASISDAMSDLTDHFYVDTVLQALYFANELHIGNKIDFYMG